ncbi:MAG TPA: energy transducer TonB [Desulfuromonadales bacterium]|nr:energy transducer TonB [Desulfuromonadales bacterium]
MLHFLALYCMWNYHATPPRTEAMAVFVSLINPPEAAQHVAQVVSKPAPVKQAEPVNEPPVLPKPMAKETPATSPAEPPAVPLQTSRVQASTASGSVTAAPVTAAVTAGVPPSHSGTVPLPQPLLLGGELSVSCPERPAPAYPKQSLRLGEQGKTVLLVELDDMGRMNHVEVKTTSGYPRLDEAAVNALKTWRCTPAKRNGVAVRSIALQPFNFSLKGR